MKEKRTTIEQIEKLGEWCST